MSIKKRWQVLHRTYSLCNKWPFIRLIIFNKCLAFWHSSRGHNNRLIGQTLHTGITAASHRVLAVKSLTLRGHGSLWPLFWSQHLNQTEPRHAQAAAATAAAAVAATRRLLLLPIHAGGVHVHRILNLSA